MSKKFTSIYDSVYRQEYCWVHATNSKEFMDMLEARVPNVRQVVEEDEEQDSDVDGETVVINIDGTAVICFWFNVANPETIVHELLHAIFACMRARNITLTEESEETFCYMLSFLYGKILEELRKEAKPTKTPRKKKVLTK